MPERIVECKPRPRNRVFVRLSGGRFFTLPDSESLLLNAGRVLSDVEIEKLSRIDQYYRGKEKALRLISIRPRTRHEIKKALEGMETTSAIREGILDELKEAGLIDDVRFAREYVRIKVDVRRLGPHRLKYELKRLGVRASIVNDVLVAEFTEGRQEAIALSLVRRKLGGQKPDEKDARRLHGLLLRKGLDYDVVNRLIYRLMTQSDISNELKEDSE